MKKLNSKEITLFIYKLLIYLAVYTIFMLSFGQINYALLKITRTSVITSITFFVSLIIFQNIYGRFTIGEEKSKPIVLSSALSLFFTNLVSFISLYIMGINEFSLEMIFWKSTFSIIVVYVLQIIFVDTFIHLGNYLYFKVVDPQKVLLISSDLKQSKKIKQYIQSYDKQYTLFDECDIKDFSEDNTKGIDRVFLVADSYETTEIIERCILKDIDITYYADIPDVISANSNYFVIDDILMINIIKNTQSFLQLFMKRSIDIIVSLLALVLTSPIFLITAVCIKLEDNGPVFFKQKRLTKNGEIFEIIKFRSMRENAGDKPAEENDDRITKVGHFIRKFRVDELPQFINILKGDMCVVGPRPESVSQFKKIKKEVPEFEQRLKVKAGLTGYAQIFGKYNTEPKQKLIFDLKYIYNFSVFEDIRLIFQTLIVFLKKDSTEGFKNE